MLRRTIALLICIYALGFAIAALAAFRWPALVFLGYWAPFIDMPESVYAMDWRRIGLVNGGGWILAALCFYLSAAATARRKTGSVIWFGLALAAAAPSFVLHKFGPVFPLPGAADGAFIGGLFGALLLLFAVRELSPEYAAARAQRAQARADMAATDDAEEDEHLIEYEEIGDDDEDWDDADEDDRDDVRATRRLRRAGPAIRRQRACFAEYGRLRGQPRFKLVW
jgi:hypothetical protein